MTTHYKRQIAAGMLLKGTTDTKDILGVDLSINSTPQHYKVSINIYDKDFNAIWRYINSTKTLMDIRRRLDYNCWDGEVGEIVVNYNTQLASTHIATFILLCEYINEHFTLPLSH